MKETAKKLNIPYTTYVNYEKGTREPNSEMLILLAKFFGVTVDYLIGNVNEPYFYLDNKRIIDEINSLDGYEEKEKPATDPDDELNEYLEELKNRDEMKMLFSLAKGATKEDVEKAVKIIEALMGK